MKVKVKIRLIENQFQGIRCYNEYLSEESADHDEEDEALEKLSREEEIEAVTQHARNLEKFLDSVTSAPRVGQAVRLGCVAHKLSAKYMLKWQYFLMSYLWSYEVIFRSTW